MRKWSKVENFLVGLLLLAALTDSFVNVVRRYVFKSTADWGEEVVPYLIIWSAFLVSSILVEKNGHVAATLVVERFPLKVRRVLAVVNGLLAMGFCLAVSWYGFQIVLQTYAFDERSITSLRFPLWISYLAIPAGCTLMCIKYCIRVYRLLFKFEVADILEGHELSREGVHTS